MVIKAYITDLSGVLMKDGFSSTIDRQEKLYGIPTGTLQEVKNKLWRSSFSLGKITEKQFWRRCFREVGIKLNEEEIDWVGMDLRASHYPYKSMLDFFKEVDKKTGLLTNTSREWFKYWNKKLSLSKIFDVVVASYQVSLRKPEDSGIYTLTLERLGVNPNEAVFIDDQLKNVRAAEEIGTKSILFKSIEQTIEKLSHYKK